MVIGKSDFVNDSPENDKLPLNWPEPFVTTPPNVGVVIVLPPSFVIVISDVVIVPVKFCWLIVNTIVSGVAVVSVELSNAYTWESTPIDNALAVDDSVTALIASSTPVPSANWIWPLTTNDVPFQVSLSPNEKLDAESM